MTEFSSQLLAWFDEHGRKDLPWQVNDPYRVWVSEIMLQQTQVQTVIPYYNRLTTRFPDVIALANADIDAVLDHWSGLGYYARARNLHKAAQVIRDQHGGEFPQTFDEVFALPGIGRSTAGAILALAFGQRHAILDGNVKRVLARHRAIPGWPGKTDVARALWAVSEHLTPADRAADYTQAIMDLGATVCRRSKPLCDLCPVMTDCAARLAGTASEYPGRKPRKEKPLKKTTMVLAVCNGAIYLERRPPTGIWGGLWSFPELVDDELHDWCLARFGRSAPDPDFRGTLRHSFSHYDLDICPVVVHIGASSSKVADDGDATWHPLDAAPPGGIAAPVGKLIESLRGEIHGQNN